MKNQGKFALLSCFESQFPNTQSVQITAKNYYYFTGVSTGLKIVINTCYWFLIIVRLVEK